MHCALDEMGENEFFLCNTSKLEPLNFVKSREDSLTIRTVALLHKSFVVSEPITDGYLLDRKSNAIYIIVP